MKLSAPPRRPWCRFSPSPGEEPQKPAQFLRALQWLCCECTGLLRRGKEARLRWLVAGAAGALLLGSPLAALASLGGSAGTIESDRALMKASVQLTQHGSYEIHEMQTPGGTVVDEYLSPQGTVFAVTWHGPFPPPMQQILGTYFEQYSAALQGRPKANGPGMYGHRPLHIQEANLVVETGGHMRAHFGRAYDPNLLPQGMTVDQIQ